MGHIWVAKLQSMHFGAWIRHPVFYWRLLYRPTVMILAGLLHETELKVGRVSANVPQIEP